MTGRASVSIMAINTLLPTVTAQFLDALRALALLTKVANRDVDNAPVHRGDTLNIRIPVAATPVLVTPGAAPVAPQVADSYQQTLQLNRWYERSMGLTDKEVNDIEIGNVPMQVNQMAVDLVEYINQDGYITANQQAGFTVNATPATNPFATDDSNLVGAQLGLDIARAPKNSRIAILNPGAYWQAIRLPNIAQAYLRGDTINPLVSGQIVGSYGLSIAADQLNQTQVTGAVGAGAMTANGAQAIAVISSSTAFQTVSIAKGAGANYAAVAGDVLQIAGHVRQYVVAVAATVVQAGNTTVTLTAPLQIALVGGEAITLVGSGTTYNNSLVFQSQALYFASRPLMDFENSGNTYTLSDAQTGLTVRGEIIRQHKQTRLAFDCLWGWKVVRPAHVGRILG